MAAISYIYVHYAFFGNEFARSVLSPFYRKVAEGLPASLNGVRRSPLLQCCLHFASDVVGALLNRTTKIMLCVKIDIDLGVTFRNVDERLDPSVGLRTPDEEVTPRSMANAKCLI